MTVRLLANENWPQPSLRALRAAGFDVLAIAELMPRASDQTVLQHAAQTGRWLLTFDRDYGELVFARQAPPPPAIDYLRQGAYSPMWPAEAVQSPLLRADWVHRHLVVVAGRSIRRRQLPAA